MAFLFAYFKYYLLLLMVPFAVGYIAEKNGGDASVPVKIELESDTDDAISSAANGTISVADDTLHLKLELHKDLAEILNERTDGKIEKKSENIGKGTNGVEKCAGTTPYKRGLAPTRRNSLNLIANSTICVFQWNKSWYRCFICTEAFPNMVLLREHASHHTLSEYEARIISQQNRLIKAEVSQLACKLCKAQVPNLAELLNHLAAMHYIPFYGVDHLLVPFKITTPLECQLCSETYDSFRLLNVHVNRHYARHVCDACGATFSSRAFLNLHRSRSHRKWRCEKCHLAFETRLEKINHDKALHGDHSTKARFPCPKCELRFTQEWQRATHLVEVHGAQKPEHRCTVCCKVFITRGLRNGHMRSTHRKERTQGCDLCPRLFYSRSDATRHRVTHTGERQFKCEACGSAFATKGSLRRHVGRSHPKTTTTSSR